MLDTLPNVWAISEPEFLTQLSFLDCDFCEPVEDVIRAGFALQCKPGIGREEVELNVVKTQGLTVSYSPLLASACPEIAQAFMFREPLGNIASIITMGRAHIEDGNYERFWKGLLMLLSEQVGQNPS